MNPRHFIPAYPGGAPFPAASITDACFNIGTHRVRVRTYHDADGRLARKLAGKGRLMIAHGDGHLTAVEVDVRVFVGDHSVTNEALALRTWPSEKGDRE